MNYIIGVDIGTTSTKAIGFNLDGSILVKKSIEYPILNPKPSYSEQDPETIFNAVLNSIKQVVNDSSCSGRSLMGVSFSAAMHSIIAVDSFGRPMTNCIIWADTRSSEYAQKLKNSDAGHYIYMRTGTPIHPMSPLCKLEWMRDNMKDIYKSAFKFISIKEYVFYKLFKEYVVDYSLASATGLFDIYELKWNNKALEEVGINEGRLSTPVPPSYQIRGMNREYALDIGIDKDIPFIIGASDGCLANLGTKAIKPGSAAITVGTSGAIRVISDKPKNDEKERIFSYILTEKHYVLGGPVNNGGIVFRWFRDNFSADEIKEAKEKNMDPYDVLTERAAQIHPGSDGLIFLPYLLGERAPHWDADAKGVFFGINIKHTRLHFLRALLEGVIFGLYSVGKALEETTGEINSIYATGGFARSDLWLQLSSDVFNKTILLAESYESSCLGAAVLGMESLGIIDNVEAVESMVPISRVFEPDLNNHGIYMENYRVFERVYEKLKEEFATITKIQ